MVSIISGVIKIKAKKLTGFEKAVGLIGKNNTLAITFNTRFGIHTFGLETPIDVLILDDKSRVVKIKRNLKPNSVFFWNPRYKKVVEFAKQQKKYSKIEVRDKINIEEY